jgi:glycosyltransferase involved in cell wall biosynthesis
MKIVLTIHHKLTTNAGAPGVVVRLAECYRNWGHEVDILSFDNLPASLSGIQCSLAFPWFVAQHILRNRREIDVVDASFGDGWVLYSSGLLHRNTLKVCHSHGLEQLFDDQFRDGVVREKKRVSWKYLVYRGGFRLWEVRKSILAADLTFFLSGSERDYAIKSFGLAENRAAVVQNGIPEWMGDQPDLPSCDQGLKVIQIGCFSERKGRSVAAAAMASIMAQRNDITLHLIGTIENRNEVLKWYPEALHSRITVVEEYEQSELPALLRDGGIKIFPSNSEGFPIAPLEAMAFGLVPITTDIPGPTEYIVHEDNGLVIPRGNAQALAAAVLRLVDDRNLRRRLSLNARKTAQALYWPKVASQRINLYKRGQMEKEAMEASGPHF